MQPFTVDAEGVYGISLKRGDHALKNTTVIHFGVRFDWSELDPFEPLFQTIYPEYTQNF